MNDLWSFNVSTGYWTWIGGSFTGSQRGVYTGINAWPGGRYGAAMWITETGLIYLFGGSGYDTSSTGMSSSFYLFIYNYCL